MVITGISSLIIVVVVREVLSSFQIIEWWTLAANQGKMADKRYFLINNRCVCTTWASAAMTQTGSLMKIDKYRKVVNSNSNNNSMMREQVNEKDEPTAIFLTNNIKPSLRLPTELLMIQVLTFITRTRRMSLRLVLIMVSMMEKSRWRFLRGENPPSKWWCLRAKRVCLLAIRSNVTPFTELISKTKGHS